MPNIIDVNGLAIATQQELINDLLNGIGDVPGLYSIYGSDINVQPNSPDGQMINIFVQVVLDVLEFLQTIYDSFDPDQAFGVNLDQRVAINGVQREAGTNTLVTVTVTVSQALTIQGLDVTASPFTVSDESGNQFQLVATHVFSGAGNADLQFQAALIGPINPDPNTIVNVVTVQLGVSSVNNAAGPTSVGKNEETDYSLRIRRANSVALPSVGYYQGLVGALGNILGVQASIVLENDTNTTDSNGIPGHSIWVIVQGGADADIANAIYVKRNAGCGMKGATTVNVTQVDGSLFPVSFDRPTAEPLWISFNASLISSGGAIDETYLRTQLLKLLTYNINQKADTSSIVALIKQINPLCYVSSEGVSTDGISYGAIKTPTAPNYQFTLSSPHIIINGNPGP